MRLVIRLIKVDVIISLKYLPPLSLGQETTDCQPIKVKALNTLKLQCVYVLFVSKPHKERQAVFILVWAIYIFSNVCK